MVNTIKHPFTGHEVRVRETLVGTGVVISDLANSQMIVVHPESAPALALAILEVAGYTECDKMARDVARSHFGDAVESLAVGVGEQVRATAEAKEQAELEAEALELFNTLQTEIHGNLGPNWIPVTEFPSNETKRKWLAVARKSRELSK